MAKTVTEIFNDKVSLIYEYDKQSPLFVRMANTEIENNNVEEAIEILNGGLKNYPQYPTAHLLLGKAYTLVGNYSLALKSFKAGSDFIHSKKTYEYYLKEIESIKKQRSLFEFSRKNIFMDAEAEEAKKDEPDLFEQPAEKNIDESLPESVDERLGQIAMEISSAKFADYTGKEKEEQSLLGSPFKTIIVSDTLAKIYVAQGEIKEAIEVYKKLLNKNPDKSDYYNKRIEELSAGLE